MTHLESEPACCPFCVETDFGVIYERPNTFSPEVAISLGSEDAELSVGIGMAPKAQESARRKSVSHKSKEVVTIGTFSRARTKTGSRSRVNAR